LRHRRELLDALAETTEGERRASLLVAAAELDEQRGDLDGALERYRRAHQAHPKDVVALRSVARAATARGNWSEAAEMLAAEAALPLSPSDRHYAYTALAEIQLHQLDDVPAAEKSAARAFQAQPSVAAALLRAECCMALGKATEARVALRKAAEHWEDAAAKGMLLRYLGRAYEEDRRIAEAHQAYTKASQADASGLEGWLGLARTARARGHLQEAVAALDAACGLLSGSLREELQRVAARWLSVLGDDPESALARLAEVRGALALQTKAELASLAGDRERALAAATAWASQAGATERALALVTVAELQTEEGNLDAADAALKEAALADEGLGTVRVVREVLARRAGDPARLAHAVRSTGEGALAAAAKLARAGGEEERDLLHKALEEAEAPVAADVLGLDAAAVARDDAAVGDALRRHVERAEPSLRLGPLMALAEHERSGGDDEAYRSRLEEARSLAPGDPVVLRALSRALDDSEPKRAAAAWLEESAAADDASQAAFAATQAGRRFALMGATEEATHAFFRAVTADESFAPAMWELERLAHREADAKTLEEVRSRLSRLPSTGVSSAGHLVRAALLAAGDDEGRTTEYLARARDAAPGDIVIADLLMRLSPPGASEDHARRLEERAELDASASGWVTAAQAWEAAGDPGKAAELHRRALSIEPENPFARSALDRVELRAGHQARVAERRFQAVKDAETDDAKARALAALAELDLYELNEPASAVLSLQSLLEIEPGHLPSLRLLERRFADLGRSDDLAWVEAQLAARIDDANDSAAHARLAARLELRGEDGSLERADAIVGAAFERAPRDRWLAHHVYAAAREAHDAARAARALDALIDADVTPMNRASLALRGAEARLAQGDVGEAVSHLQTHLAEAPMHPVATERLGRLLESQGDRAAAARAFEEAARAARLPRRVTGLWHEAGALWQSLGDFDRAMNAYDHAAAFDIAHRDLFDRMRDILRSRGETSRLVALIDARLAAGADSATLIRLHQLQAELCEELADREGAKQALRATLALDPDRVDALRRLAELTLEDEQWREAAERLIRLARLRQERDELRWVFFTLGVIYDEHIPDAHRAEAAYRRVLKLKPDEWEAGERLAALYRRSERSEDAALTLTGLLERTRDPDRAHRYHVELASIREQQGRLKEAETELEQARRTAPTDLSLLDALARFYQRQNAHSALAMHLGRAVGDFRQSIGRSPDDPAAWSGLATVLAWRERPDAARACASAAYALGLVDVELARHLDEHGAIPGAEASGASSELDGLIAPPMLSQTVRRVMQLAEPGLVKHIGFDPRDLSVEKVDRNGEFRAAAERVASWFELKNIQVVSTGVAPRLCIPIASSASSVTVAVGRDLLGACGSREQLFLLTRAVKIAVSGLAVTVQAQPGDLQMALDGLIRSVEPNYEPRVGDPAQVDAAGKKVLKSISRRQREELIPLLRELVGMASFEPQQLGLAASELGDRVGLIVTGSAPDALRALLRLAGAEASEAQTAARRVQAVKSVQEAWSLLSFAISDAHFEARHRCGADAR
jgi:tetratricopeptide (TPR) repeat protein